MKTAFESYNTVSLLPSVANRTADRYHFLMNKLKNKFLRDTPSHTLSLYLHKERVLWMAHASRHCESPAFELMSDPPTIRKFNEICRCKGGEERKCSNLSLQVDFLPFFRLHCIFLRMIRVRNDAAILFGEESEEKLLISRWEVFVQETTSFLSMRIGCDRNVLGKPPTWRCFWRLFFSNGCGHVARGEIDGLWRPRKFYKLYHNHQAYINLILNSMYICNKKNIHLIAPNRRFLSFIVATM